LEKVCIIAGASSWIGRETALSLARMGYSVVLACRSEEKGRAALRLIRTRQSVTIDGLETTFQVNYLSHFLLTHLLLGELRRGAPSRIINASSAAHYNGHICFDDLHCSKRCGAFRSYWQSKLAQITFTYRLARLLKGTGIDADCLHPGALAGNWGRDAGSWPSLGVRLASPFEISPRKGAKTSVYPSSSPEVKGVAGKHFSDMREERELGGVA
jgi:NAD(P)-dependent dehydrogenase (short-subunit alcohol dehydrogenase family)